MLWSFEGFYPEELLCVDPMGWIGLYDIYEYGIICTRFSQTQQMCMLCCNLLSLHGSYIITNQILVKVCRESGYLSQILLD